MTPEIIAEMEEKIMLALYKALTEGKITTVQGMCDVLEAIYDYVEHHYQKTAETVVDII